jgi:hypothetical protein
MLEFLISNPHFFIVIATASTCMFISLSLYIKERNLNLLRYLLFFCFSIITSLQTLLNHSIYLSNIILAIFFTYDFIFLLSFTEKILFSESKYYKSKYFIISILAIILYIIFYKNILAIQFISGFYSLITLSITIPFMRKYYKDNKNKILINEHQYWILSGFLINSLATFTCSIMIILSKDKSTNTMYLLLFLTMYISWVIKYLMIIKSNICLMKQIKFGA